MTKILGIDPASTVGYALLDGNKLDDYGTIVCPFKQIGQRLNFIANETTRLVQKLSPDYIAIEDTILGIGGVRTTILLGRISGCIILECYKCAPVSLYIPSAWKKNCDLKIKGNAKKWETQISVIDHFSLLPKEKIQSANIGIQSALITPNKTKKWRDKEIQEISKELHSLSGISFDIADAIGIALCKKVELEK